MSPNHPLMIYNLLNNFEDLCSLLIKEVRLGGWLNSYLLAAGMNQILEDHLHPDPLNTGKIAKNLVRLNLPAGGFLSAAALKAGEILLSLESLKPQSIKLFRLQQEFAGIVQSLADAVAGNTPSLRPGLIHEIQSCTKAINDTVPKLSSEVLRLPSCYRSFDQQPADIERLVQEFADRVSDRYCPLAVLGVRTSGSYLAPLGAAYLKSSGFHDVTALTFRPGRKFLSSERNILKSIAERGGMILVVDDPPATGSSLLRTVKELEKSGIPAQAIVLLLQLFGPVETLPQALRGYSAVLLPWDNWTIQEKVAPVSIHLMLDEIFSQEATVNSVIRLPLAERKWERSHIRALYEINMTEIKNGRERNCKVFVEGAGMGYFGEHALAVKSAMGDYLPDVYGFRDGLLFRAWLPEQNRVASRAGVWNKKYLNNLVNYVHKRHQVLAVPKDVSRQLKGENSTWEVASNLLSKAYGKGWMLARVFFTDRIARKLLEVKNPSVIDGKMDLDNWFIHETGDDHLLKIGFSERDFSNLDLYSYDPIFDLAGLATSRNEPDFSELIYRTYQEVTGEQIKPERWLLYQWIHLWDERRLQRRDPEQCQDALAHLFQHYFSQIYFKDLRLPSAGPFCALDVDGVLETAPLGFSQLTPSSALTLRALIMHGFRPLLATGRSLDEVQDRCNSYQLAGGTAEYGAVIYDHATGKVEELLSEADCRNLDRLRIKLREIRSVFVDDHFRYAVRAYRKDADGNHYSLSPDDISLAMEMSHLDVQMRIIPGQHQTDFMVASIDKGSGLRCLLEELNGRSPAKSGRLAFAVGDTMSDLPMFSLASKSYIPGHGDQRIVRQGVQRMAKPYQSGLAQAAEAILGHKPGTCPVCNWSAQSRQRELFLGLLSAQEGGTWGILTQALKLSASSKW